MTRNYSAERLFGFQSQNAVLRDDDILKAWNNISLILHMQSIIKFKLQSPGSWHLVAAAVLNKHAVSIFKVEQNMEVAGS